MEPAWTQVAQIMDRLLWQHVRDDGISEMRRVGLYVAEHRLIYENVVTGDTDVAAFYAEQHIRQGQKDMGLD